MQPLKCVAGVAHPCAIGKGGVIALAFHAEGIEARLRRARTEHGAGTLKVNVRTFLDLEVIAIDL